MPPTLLQKGKIVPQKWFTSDDKKLVTELTAIEYIVQFIAQRWSENDSIEPKIPPKGPGSKVIALLSATGSGKSTVLPPYFYREFVKPKHKNLVVTQPRRLTTVDIPYQIVTFNSDIELGQHIGYQTGTLSRKPTKGILFATVGVLLQIMKNSTDEEILKKYSFFIVDEVHERSVEEDTLLYYIKQFLIRNWSNKQCPFVILTSGTFDHKPFMTYFKCPKENFIEVSGWSFPIKDIYPSYNPISYLAYVRYLIEKIHVENIADITQNKELRDIIVFVQGGSQINKLVEIVNSLNTDVFYDDDTKNFITHLAQTEAEIKIMQGGKEKAPSYCLVPIPLMSENISKGSTEYINLFSKIDSVSIDVTHKDGKVSKEKGSRRIIFATNAAETGITIDTLGYCIDTGWVQETQYNPCYGATGLIEKPVSQANSRQRRGRVGRKGTGEFYPIYTKSVFDKMETNALPEILREDISTFILSVICNETETEQTACDKKTTDSDTIDYINDPTIKNSDTCFLYSKYNQEWVKLECKKKFDVQAVDFFQSPSNDSLSAACEKLHCLGFISQDFKPTLFGFYANKFRKIKLEHIRMIFAGYHTGAHVLDLITIIAMWSNRVIADKKKYKSRNPLLLPVEQHDEFLAKILDENIDLLFVYYEYLSRVSHLTKFLEKDKPIPLGHLTEWCDENGLSYDALQKVTAYRDELLDDILSLNLNPFYSSYELSPGLYNIIDIMSRNFDEGLVEIKRIKQCIYEGHRFNLCVQRDNELGYRINHNGVNIKIKSDVTKNKITKPRYIIATEISISKTDLETSTYGFTGASVSVLDNFVPVDIAFLM
jgi:HrpA-like RNA helicase